MENKPQSPVKKTRYVYRESIEQRLFFSSVNILHSSGVITDREWRLTRGISNGGKKTLVYGKRGLYCPEGKRLKDEGVKKGTPDISIKLARKGYHGLEIELKPTLVKGVPKNYPTLEQKVMIQDLLDEGYLGVVCYGYQEALNVYLDYLGIQST